MVILPTQSALELLSEPPASNLGLDQFARLIAFDRRGSGLSDPSSTRPPSRSRWPT